MVNCFVCNKPAYAAESVQMGGNTFHKTCFACQTCKKSMAVSEASDHDGLPYCKSCHGRAFGPKGYGYGTGAGVLTETGISLHSNGDIQKENDSNNNGSSNKEFKGVNNIKSKFARFSGSSKKTGKRTSSAKKKKFNFGSSNNCPKCSKPVYPAEQIKALGYSWHKTCFRCQTCNKTMNTAGEASDHNGMPYCKACYGKSFGPKGIGFGVMTDSGIGREVL